MTDKSEIVTVPRDLYYHEVAYVRGLEADNERLTERIYTLVTERDAERKIYNEAIARHFADNERLTTALYKLRELVNKQELLSIIDRALEPKP